MMHVLRRRDNRTRAKSAALSVTERLRGMAAIWKVIGGVTLQQPATPCPGRSLCTMEFSIVSVSTSALGLVRQARQLCRARGNSVGLGLCSLVACRVMDTNKHLARDLVGTYELTSRLVRRRRRRRQMSCRRQLPLGALKSRSIPFVYPSFRS